MHAILDAATVFSHCNGGELGLEEVPVEGECSGQMCNMML